MIVAPKEIANQVLENLRGTPFVMALLVINVIVLMGFAFTLHEVADSIERRDKTIEKCLEMRRPP